MRLFHLSDLHLGLKLMNHDLLEDQYYILDQIADLVKERKPDAILIAGDIYDKAVPSAEAVDLFDHFILSLRKASSDTVIMMISGNHDSASRINVFRDILSDQNIYMIGQPPRLPEEHIAKVVMQDEQGEVCFYLLPFVKPSMVKLITGTDEKGNNLSYNEAMHKLLAREDIDPTKRNVLLSHQFYLPVGVDAETIERSDTEIRMVGNIDEIGADVLHRFDYAALGHIHKPMTVGDKTIRYCGTPMAYSISEAGQKKGIIEVDLSVKGDVQTQVLPLKPLHAIRKLEGELNTLIKQPSDDYVSVCLTDEDDLEIMDMKTRLLAAFPNLLEIKRSQIREADYSLTLEEEDTADPFTLCSRFLKDLDEHEADILRDIINTVQGGEL